MTERTTSAETTEDDDRPVVLAVDDEPRVVQAFELWLGDDYRIVSAVGGQAAIDQFDRTVDIVLLDRHMPEVTGEAVLEHIEETPHDPWIIMVTAVDPDFDIIEMPFDEYLSKPVDGAELRTVIDQLLEIGDYDDRLNELYAVTSKIATLQSEMTNSELTQNEQYNELVERRDRLRHETKDRLSDLDDFESVVGQLFDSR